MYIYIYICICVSTYLCTSEVILAVTIMQPQTQLPRGGCVCLTNITK